MADVFADTGEAGLNLAFHLPNVKGASPYFQCHDPTAPQVHHMEESDGRRNRSDFSCPDSAAGNQCFGL